MAAQVVIEAGGTVLSRLQVTLSVGPRAGAAVVTTPRFDLHGFLRLVQDHDVTRAEVVPPIVLGLARHPAVSEYDLSSLRLITSGAAPLSGDLVAGCAARLGCRVKQAYGIGVSREKRSPTRRGWATVAHVLNGEQLHEFGERGFLVLPRVVPREVVGAAARAIDELIEREPPAAGVRGPFNYFPEAARAPELAALLTGSPAFGLAESLTGPGTLVAPWQVQIALNIPPNPHRPGMHHIDGFPPEPDGRPGTFTMLAGVLMSDQRGPDAGNLWVWPGTHLTHADYFREHGPGAFFAAGGYPPIRLPEPEQVAGGPGDLLLAHYLLGHNIGGNTSPTVRRAVYFRVKRVGHDPRWREFLQDPWLDYDAVREQRGNTTPC